jgi:hypothetical protein
MIKISMILKIKKLLQISLLKVIRLVLLKRIALLPINDETNEIITLIKVKKIKDFIGKRSLVITDLYLDVKSIEEYKLEAKILKLFRTLQAGYSRKGYSYILIPAENIKVINKKVLPLIKNNLIITILLSCDYKRNHLINFTFGNTALTPTVLKQLYYIKSL